MPCSLVQTGKENLRNLVTRQDRTGSSVFTPEGTISPSVQAHNLTNTIRCEAEHNYITAFTMICLSLCSLQNV